MIKHKFLLWWILILKNLPEKAQYLLKHWEGGERLRLFKADLQEEGSFDEAVRGCSGIYHVAASMEFDIPVKDNVGNVSFLKIISNPYKKINILVKLNSLWHCLFWFKDSYVQANVIEPAIRGTLNVLKACLKTNSVRRVIFTSSVSTMTAKDSLGNWRPFVDESCKTPIDLIWRNKPNGWVFSSFLTCSSSWNFHKSRNLCLPVKWSARSMSSWSF